jgi:hypothetical protein
MVDSFLQYQAVQKQIELIDADALATHNQKFPIEHKYHLHADMKPCPYEGNPMKAKVLLLLANPQWTNESQPSDHVPIDGWGIWGLSSKSNASMRDWWRPRLRSFVSDYTSESEWQELSTKFSSFQAVAWASNKFHECNSLPSKKLMRDLLSEVIKSRTDLTVVVMRQRTYWNSVLKDSNARILYTKNPICSYLTENNFYNKIDWKNIIDVIEKE